MKFLFSNLQWIKQNEYDLKRNLKNFVEKQKARENKE